MKNLNEIIKENEEGFEKEFVTLVQKDEERMVRVKKGNSYLLRCNNEEGIPSPSMIKSHLHQSQLNIVEWVREWAKEQKKENTNFKDNDYMRGLEAGKNYAMDDLLQELDKIV